jgi:hypothetical protein
VRWAYLDAHLPSPLNSKLDSQELALSEVMDWNSLISVDWSVRQLIEVRHKSDLPPNSKWTESSEHHWVVQYKFEPEASRLVPINSLKLLNAAGRPVARSASSK